MKPFKPQSHICLIYSGALGNKIHGELIRDSLKNYTTLKISHYSPTFPYKNLNNFLGYKFPILGKRDLDFYSFRSHLIVNYEVKKYIENIKNKMDLLFIHTHSLAFFLKKEMKTIPTIVSLDAPHSILSAWGWEGMLPYTRYTWMPSIIYERKVFSLSKKIIVMSKWAKNILIEKYKIPDKKIIIIPSPIHIPIIDIGKKNNTDDKIKLLFIGGDFKRKGGDILLQCFKKYFSENCELHLVTQASIKKTKNVFVYKNISIDSLNKLYTNADIFVFPTKYEPFGRVIPEAMSYGLPIISSNVAAIPEMIENGKNGFLITPDNIHQLREKIEILKEDYRLRISFGKHGRYIAKKRYDIKNISQKIYSLICHELSIY